MNVLVTVKLIARKNLVFSKIKKISFTSLYLFIFWIGISVSADELEEGKFLELLNDISVEQNLCKRMALIQNNINYTTNYERFVLLPVAAKTAFRIEQFEDAKVYAKELLKLSTDFTDDWNHGNAIHDGNMVLGLIEVRSVNIEEAEQKLLEAANTSGSPQIKSFEPNMMLANELLNYDRDDIVVQYLGKLKSVWKKDKGKIDNWISSIKDGGRPSFGSNLTL